VPFLHAFTVAAGVHRTLTLPGIEEALAPHNGRYAPNGAQFLKYLCAECEVPSRWNFVWPDAVKSLSVPAKMK
jgi:hypothetical protein